MTWFRPTRLAATAAASLTLALAATLAASPAQAAPAEPSPTDPTARSYAALGDSYASGPLIPVQTGLPAGCQRSNRNYPSLVARTLDVPEFRDVSCSGATTEELAGSQRVPFGVNPPQLDALDTDTGLVTLTMGGNDIGFGEIIRECAARSGRDLRGAACQDFFTSDDGTDELAERIEDTAPRIAQALAEIESRSPDARVLLVGYPAILPDTGPGCFPVVPFSPGDVAYLRETTKRLNAMLTDEADEAGVDYVDVYTATIGHDACQPRGQKWIEGLVPTSAAAPVHPNALGMVAIAQAVVGELTDQTVLASDTMDDASFIMDILGIFVNVSMTDARSSQGDLVVGADYSTAELLERLENLQDATVVVDVQVRLDAEAVGQRYLDVSGGRDTAPLPR